MMGVLSNFLLFAAQLLASCKYLIAARTLARNVAAAAPTDHKNFAGATEKHVGNFALSLGDLIF